MPRGPATFGGVVRLRFACPNLGLALAAAALAATLAAAAVAQAPGPEPKSRDDAVTKLAAEGQLALRREDPVSALAHFRELRALAPDDVAGLIGLGETRLCFGDPATALRYAGAALALAPRHGGALALRVRALLRARHFDEATAFAREAVQRATEESPDLLAAFASALFRTQQVEESARVYQRVLELDPDHAEAHLRLGSGLLGSRTAVILPQLEAGATAVRAGQRERALAELRLALQLDPGHPIAHRLLGELLFTSEADLGFAATAPEFLRLRAVLPVPAMAKVPARDFLADYDVLAPSRRDVVTRAVALFGRLLPQLLAMGGRHDLLGELERTTDSPARASLRGKRTFDGRVWDDVRGMGGLRAATGIEALDEAAQWGFDTLSHELAHQAHLYAFRPVERRRIRALYEKALLGDHCLDYYAASNEAEYFGQGVEAFASLAKRPGRESTHGHTRFELYRLDRELHDLIAGLVDFDPLRDPSHREEILAAAVQVALRCGRPLDALTAVEMMRDGPQKEVDRGIARRSLVLVESY